jgi:hypothetical protein
MTEAEVMELTMMCVENAMTSFSLFVTVTFAYLMASFVIGSKLSSFQSLAVSGLYVVTAGIAISCTILYVRTWGELRSGIPGGIEVMDNIALWNESLWLYYPTVTCVVGIGVSLYFMWNVRHPKTE